VLILSFYAQSKVKGNYNKYLKIKNNSGKTGQEIARYILDKNDLNNIEILPINGILTDHYDPQKHQLHLSEDVYYGDSISSASIAAHETGHALQHAQKYLPLIFRAQIVPIANLGSTAAFPLFLMGLFFRMSFLMNLGIIFFSGALLFHLITLPVEFDASHRAMIELKNSFLIENHQIKSAKAVLNAAALTYVASTLMALVQLIRLIVLRNSRD
jgi:Zn-dependent membrane protease YugP